MKTLTYVPSIDSQSHALDAAFIVLDHVELCLRNPFRYFSPLWFYLRAKETNRYKKFVQAGFLARAMQRKKIRRLHAHFANIPTFVAELVKRLSGITYSFADHATDIYLTNKHTEYNQRYLQDAGGGCTPIVPAYHGVDLRSFSTPDAVAPRVEPPLILSVGRFCEKKGFPYLIQACRLLKESGYRFRCMEVGPSAKAFGRGAAAENLP